MSPRALRLRLGLFTAGLWLLRAARTVLAAEIILFLAATGLSYFKDVHDHKAFARVLAVQAEIERPSGVVVKKVLPTNFKGTDISRWLFVFLVYMGSTALGRAGVALGDRLAYLRRRRAAGEQGSDMASLQKSLESLAQGEKLDRKKLLQIYAEAKRTLEEQKRHLAFLSIDVVNSTGMKVGESAEVAERDFILYKKLVERALKAHRALKATWTPDGVMICFAEVPDAVEAALEIVRGLDDFNQKVKAIKHDFAVRIGINAGEVSYDETIPMEEMTDRVIDITGHMQKHGTINSVCVTKSAIEPHLARFKFKPTERVVDGCQVYEG